MTAIEEDLNQAIRVVENFPIPGVRFRDISPILEDAQLFDQALQELSRGLEFDRFDIFVGIESRGFILAAALAAKFKKGFLPLRKAGKLPPPVLSQAYHLEYAQATLELRKPAFEPSASGVASQRVVLVDDVLATGGTLAAAVNLLGQGGMSIVDVRVLIDLVELNQFRFKGKPVTSVLQY